MLVIAKLGRLSRNLEFIAMLMDRKVDFVCCDNPAATKFTIHILAGVAEHEGDAISCSTKAALAAAEANGKRPVAEMNEHVEDADGLIDSWIESFSCRNASTTRWRRGAIW
jgi:DNA invertase Pin-like site-specific DNA recombinase